jgi:aryl-alcohol dehydrogenase-like predicted oxidoreductase
MLTRRLGKSDIEVSALGMGCWAIGGPWTWEHPGTGCAGLHLGAG